MKIITVVSILAAGFVAAPGIAFAAHAGAPYTNVDHRNDAGNDTGDSKVDGLNAAQLDENYRGPVEMRAPAAQPAAPVVVMPNQR